VLVTDPDHRPLGWLHREHIPARLIVAEDVEGTSPLMDRRTTLKDALSMLLEADVQAGLVVDRTGAVRGMVRLPDVVEWSRGHGLSALDPERAEPAVREAVADQVGAAAADVDDATAAAAATGLAGPEPGAPG
jgi:CBS domain containing-hemolysin-like protein